MFKVIFSIIIGMFLSLSCYSNIENWHQKTKVTSLKHLLKNISPQDANPGFIMASPSRSNPNYYYHWVRDAALVMDAIYKTLPYSEKKSGLFLDYINIVKSNQNEYSLTWLGEPKFNADGTSFKGPWGRPQNDGPAIRALSLIKWAFQLIKLGKKDQVKEMLYSNNLPADTVIKKDLEYISHHWRELDFDLWEEVKGTHFFTRMAQRAAMYYGAKLANVMNDGAASSWYITQFHLINNQLKLHITNEGYIQSTINRVDGLDYKASGLDSSTILAVNLFKIPGESFWATDPSIIKTYMLLKHSFRTLYSINKRYDGVGIGRYPEDRYYGGNPWFILTNAMSEYMFDMYEITGLKKYKKEAESYLKRVKTHIGENGHMSEQFDKENGFMLGARDLTWSYASFLTVQ